MGILEALNMAGVASVIGVMWNLEAIVPLLPAPYNSPAAAVVATNVSWWFSWGVIFGGPMIASHSVLPRAHWSVESRDITSTPPTTPAEPTTD